MCGNVQEVGAYLFWMPILLKLSVSRIEHSNCQLVVEEINECLSRIHTAEMQMSLLIALK